MKTPINYLLLAILCLALLTNCNTHSPTNQEAEVPEEQDPKGITIQPIDFLSEEQYDQLIVEIVYIEGFKLNTNSLYQLASFMEERLHKSAGISIISKAIPSEEKVVYSITDLEDLEEQYRSHQATDKALSVWIAIVDTDYSANENDTKALGVAYGASSMALFGKTIQEFSGEPEEPSTQVLESTVLKHEFCHILGLVNKGTPMVNNHLDTQHDKHCSNNNCLMHYTAETSDFLSNFIAGIVPSLREQCLNDLKNNGGK
ncbi:hypothetical protein [Sunxiuqinia sp. sy24]|uniref:hypothetical protein n=1 Tax=Sunxiuqinia sp. sy24 TaxID=3461495 RepID=UPI00404662F4